MTQAISNRAIRQIQALSGLDFRQPQAAATAVIAKRASELAPRDTGFMAEHITGDENGVNSEADYTIFVEFGTSRMEAKPFLRPAVVQTQREAAEAAAKVLEEEIRKTIKAAL
jgi:HK97 gp10 family phage protein